MTLQRTIDISWSQCRSPALCGGMRRQGDNSVLPALRRAAANGSREAVTEAVWELCDHPVNRSGVLRELVDWTHPFNRDRSDAHRWHNLRCAGLSSAQLVLGLTESGDYLRSLPGPDPTRGDPDQALVARLFRRVLQDEQTREDSVHTLIKVGAKCAREPDSAAARGLVQLVDTVAPDLHLRVSHPLFDEMHEDFPMSLEGIERLLTTLQWLRLRHGRG